MSDEKEVYEGSEDDVVEILESRDRDEHPVMSTQQIADHVSVTRRTVVNRLQVLEAGGRVEAVDLGRDKGWYLPSDQFLAGGDETVETVATDGALALTESSATDHLLKTQNKMYEDNMRYRAQLSKQERSTAATIVPLLAAFSISLILQTTPGVPYLQPLGGFLLLVSVVAGVRWVYKYYTTEIPEPPALGEEET